MGSVYGSDFPKMNRVRIGIQDDWYYSSKNWKRDESNFEVFVGFFNCYLVASRPTLAHSRGVSLTNTMLIIAFSTIST